MNKRIVFGAFSILASLGMMGSAAFAAFSSSASNNGNTFTSGSLTLAIDGAAGTASTPKFTVANILPGTSVSQDIDLSNTGTTASTHTLLTSVSHSSSSSPDLGGKLTLALIDDPDHDDTVVNGQVVDHGALDDHVRGSFPITSVSWANVDLGFGLAVSGHHHVWAQITFDPTADNTFQN